MREPQEYPSASFRMIAVVALLVGVGAGVFAFFSFVLPSLSDGGKTVYIQADNSPIKTPPNQPGGMDVPHQDKLVFNSVAAPNARQNPPERLAPPPEEPVYGSNQNSPAIQSGGGTSTQESLVVTQLPAGRTDAPGAKAPQVPAALGRAIQPVDGPAPAVTPESSKPSEITSFDPDKQDGKLGRKVKIVSSDSDETPEQNGDGSLVIEYPGSKKSGSAEPLAQEEAAVVAEATAPPMALTPQTPSEEGAAQEAANPLLATEEVQKNYPAEQKTVALTPAPKPESSSGSARFQLASFTDRESADSAIENLKNKYASALGGASLHVASATVKGKQVFRVQGSAASKEEVDEICTRVKASGGACVPAR
jgi:hypothetical protein